LRQEGIPILSISYYRG